MRKSTILFGIGVLGVGMLVSIAQAEVVFRPASTSPAQGFKVMNSLDGRYYVSGDTAFTDAQVTAAHALRGGSGLQLAVNANLGGADRLALFVDGEFVGAPKVRATDGSILLTELSRTSGAHIANVLGNTGAPANAALLSVQVAEGTVAPGGTVTADVYVSRVIGLNTYQVRVNATSADAGLLSVSNLRIDKTREDFVFAGGEALDAVDSNQFRMGAVLFNAASVDSVDRLYLGTYTFDVPRNASGSLHVGVEVSNESFLKDTQGGNIAFRVASVSVPVSGTRPALGR